MRSNEEESNKEEGNGKEGKKGALNTEDKTIKYTKDKDEEFE